MRDIIQISTMENIQSLYFISRQELQNAQNDMEIYLFLKTLLDFLYIYIYLRQFEKVAIIA